MVECMMFESLHSYVPLYLPGVKSTIDLNEPDGATIHKLMWVFFREEIENEHITVSFIDSKISAHKTIKFVEAFQHNTRVCIQTTT